MNKNILLLYLLPFLLLVFIHLLTAQGITEPWVFADEFVMLGHARYLAGGNSIYINSSPIYHFGYSLFLMPAFWLFSDPQNIYKAVLFINALLISSSYFLLFYIANNIFKINRIQSSIISFLVNLYPAFFVYSSTSYTNNIFVPAYLLFIIGFVIFIKKPNNYLAAMFGFLTSFLYAIHPRAFFLLPLTVIWIVLLVYNKKLSKTNAIFSISFIILFYSISKYIILFLTALGYDHLITYSFTNDVLPFLMTWEGIKYFVLAAIGQLWYLSHVAIAIPVVGIFYTIFYLYTRNKNNFKSFFTDNESIFISFILSTTLIIFITSLGVFLLSMKWGNLRGDHFIYGRYNDGFIAIYILLGLIAFIKKSLNFYVIIIPIFLTAIIYILLGHSQLLSLDVSVVTIAGISSYFHKPFDLTHNLWSISAIIVLLYLFFYIIYKKNYNKIALSFLSVIFLASIFINYYFFVFPIYRNNENLNDGLSSFLKENFQIRNVSYHMSVNKDEGYDENQMTAIYRNFYTLQFIIPNLELVAFKNSNINSIYKHLSNNPQTEYVIAEPYWQPDDHSLKFEKIFTDKNNYQSIWKRVE